MRSCKLCGLTKPLFEFVKDKSCTSGYGYKCKPCKNLQTKKHYDNNKEKMRERTRKYREENPLKARASVANYSAKNKEILYAKTKEWRKTNQEKVKAAKKLWEAANKEKIKQYSAKTYQKHKVEVLQKCREYYEANKNKFYEYQKAYRAKNIGRVRSRLKARKKAVKMATPSWVDLSHIDSFYKTAAALEMHTGDFYHVDHIVPLVSKVVCGLHCPSNLRVIPAKENIVKGNRWWPDMPI